MGAKTFRQKSNVMMPAQELTTHSNRTDTFQRAQQAPVQESKLTGLMNVLSDVLPDTASAVTSEIGIALEEDKVRQEQEANLDREPTEDATVYGKSAHHAVVARNETNVTRRELEGQAKTFEGSDDEWQAIEQQAFKDLLERTGGSHEDMAVTGQMFREQMSKTADIRYNEKQRQDQQQKYNDHHDSIIEGALATDSLGDSDEFDLIMDIAFNEAEEMGMTSDMQEKAFLDAAVALANDQDDDRLLEYAKEIGIYNRSPALQQAQTSLTGRLLAERNGDIARSAYNFEEEAYMNKYEDFDEFSREVEQARTPEDVVMHSASHIRSMWDSAERRQNADHRSQLVVDNMLNLDVGSVADRAEARIEDGTLDPVAFLNMNKETTAAVLAELDNRWAKNLNEALEGTDDAVEKQAILSEHRQKRSALLSENQLIDDGMRELFNNMEGFPIEGMDTDVLTPQLYVALSTLADLENTPSGLVTHASPKAIAMSDFYQKGKARGLNDRQAFEEAKRMAGSKPVSMGGKDREKFDNKVDKALNAEYDHSFYEFWQPSSISDSHKAKLNSEIGSYARQLMVENNDADRSIELATKAVIGNYTQLPNGSPVYGKPAWLGQQMGLPANEAIAKLDNLAERLSLASAEDGLENLMVNTDIPYDEWIPEISSNGTIRFRDTEGNAITSPLLLSAVGGVSLKQKVKHIADREKNTSESRLRRMHMNKTKGHVSTDLRPTYNINQ